MIAKIGSELKKKDGGRLAKATEWESDFGNQGRGGISVVLAKHAS